MANVDIIPNTGVATAILRQFRAQKCVRRLMDWEGA